MSTTEHRQTPQATIQPTTESRNGPVVIVGGAGKTGQRVADRLVGRGRTPRFASRSTSPVFDWTDQTTWRGALEGPRAAYVAYQPDLAAPGAAHHAVTVCRVAWFDQNFTQGALAGAVPTGVFALPAPADVPEPFVDLDDVADVAVLPLTEDGHAGVVHELTGPEALTLDPVAQLLSEAASEPVHYVATTTGVRDALRREPRSIGDWAQDAAAQGLWGGAR